MAKLKGNDIMVHLQAIPMQSELYSYMMRVLKVHIASYLPFTPLIFPHLLEYEKRIGRCGTVVDKRSQQSTG